MYLKYIKLISGDNIIATTEDDCSSLVSKEFITITNPVRIGVITLPGRGMHIETHVFLPWITLAASDSMQLPTRSIVIAVDVEESINMHYQEFISKNNSTTIREGSFPSMEDYYDGDEEEDEEDEEEENDDRDEHPTSYH